MDWHLIAIIAPIVLVGYLAVTEWVPMFPFNDLESSRVEERLLAASINYPVMLGTGLAFLVGGSVGIAFGMVGCVAVMVGHILSWWLPYFGLSSDGQRQAYDAEYTRTIKLLPTAGHAVVIDAQHMVVGVLASTMLVAGAFEAAAAFAG